MRVQEQCSLYVSQKTYKKKTSLPELKCGGVVWACRKTAAAKKFAAVVLFFILGEIK